MRIEDKLTILADAAKYDVSCASSGSRRKNSGGRLGNAATSGICHSYTEDGRCVSLLKILFTNVCIYDCAYCVNRVSNDVPRTAFTSREIVSLTIDFYRRNYIEGLFLSSGIVRSPDETMERLVRTIQVLRKQGFNGYVHLKCVPFASRRLIQAAGRLADRLSVNIELPSETSLKRLTQAKTFASVLTPMGVIKETIAETREDRKRLRHVPAFAPGGQSTQLIVGASPESDFDLLTLALIAPRYDVLPLIRRHFESRFADQAWMIVDTQRNYGLCYDQGHTRELQVDPATLDGICQGENADEHLCQTLWQRYYTAVNVHPRSNPRLHVSKLPRRYWRYLTEKQT